MNRSSQHHRPRRSRRVAATVGALVLAVSSTASASGETPDRPLSQEEQTLWFEQRGGEIEALFPESVSPGFTYIDGTAPLVRIYADADAGVWDTIVPSGGTIVPSQYTQAEISTLSSLLEDIELSGGQGFGASYDVGKDLFVLHGNPDPAAVESVLAGHTYELVLEADGNGFSRTRG